MRKVIIFLFLFFINDFVYAENLANFNTSNLNIKLISNNNEFKFLIKPIKDLGTTELTANTFVLKSPNRLVIDIPEVTTSQQNFISLKNKHLSAIRVGKHNNKIRAVVDIKSNKSPEYDIYADQELQSLVVKFNFEEPKSTAKVIKEEEVQKKIVKNNQKEEEIKVEKNLDKKMLDKKAVKEVRSTTKTKELSLTNNIISNSSKIEKKFIPSGEILTKAKSIFTMRGNEKVDGFKPSVKSLNKNLHSKEISTNPAIGTIKSSETELSKSKQNQKDSNLNSRDISVIKNILFQAHSDSNTGALVIEASNIGEYKIAQKGKNLYELRIENSKLIDERLTLPQFPPDTFQNFEVILTNQLKNNVVLVKIYLNADIQLEPSIIDNKLWIRTSSN